MKTHNTNKLRAAVLSILVLAGCQSAPSMSEQDAKKLALQQAKVAEEDLTAMETVRKKEDGKDVYQITFSDADKTYTYAVDFSGNVVSSSWKEKNAAAAEGTANDTGQNTAGATDKDGAAAIALRHAGVKEAEAASLRVKPDREDGQAVYEVEFYVGDMEYDYKIIQADSSILKYSQDLHRKPASANQSAISLSKAAELALARVSGATKDQLRIEEDREDGGFVYEGKILHDNAEYEFTMDAANGDFLEWSVDYGR